MRAFVKRRWILLSFPVLQPQSVCTMLGFPTSRGALYRLATFLAFVWMLLTAAVAENEPVAILRIQSRIEKAQTIAICTAEIDPVTKTARYVPVSVMKGEAHKQRLLKTFKPQDSDIGKTVLLFLSDDEFLLHTIRGERFTVYVEEYGRFYDVILKYVETACKQGASDPAHKK